MRFAPALTVTGFQEVKTKMAYPNLKITVGNDRLSEDEGSTEEGELEERNDDLMNVQNETKDVEIHRKFVSPLERSRVYENRGGAFITGLDLTSEAVTKKLVDRAARFGLEESVKKAVTQDDIKALYKSLEIDVEDMKNPTSKLRNIRLDAVHMRGVDEMSTSDVIDYFKEYGPASVEWINDFSCNVVWLDSEGAARALLGLSRVLVVKKKKKIENESIPKNENSCASSQEEKEEVIFMSDISSGSDDDDDDEDEDDKLVGFKHEKKGNPECVAMDVDETDDKPVAADDKHVEESPNLDVPVPPGHWRLGIPHPKAKAVLLRFATKDDRKLPGAERRSQYYQKYGNPNYGGLKGIISKTRKRRFNATKQRQVVEQLSGGGNSTSLSLGLSSETKADDVTDSRRRKPKKLRMRMCADDEEERLKKLKKKSLRRHLLEDRIALKRRKISEDELPVFQHNVYDRLGTLNREEPLELPYGDSMSDEEFSDVNVKSAVLRPHAGSSNMDKFSRFNVWTRIAESMARESDDPERSYREKPKYAGEDLREKLQAQKSARHSRTDFGGDSGSDLRSKLDRLRRHDSLTKHRSPLLISDET